MSNIQKQPSIPCPNTMIFVLSLYFHEVGNTVKKKARKVNSSYGKQSQLWEDAFSSSLPTHSANSGHYCLSL